jgi:membrane protease YdiL (CAAX protease family)
VRRVWLYLALAFAISWGAYALRRFGSFDPVADEALRLTVKFGPSLAGVGVAAAYGGKAGLVDLLIRLRPPVRHARWVAIAFGLPIMIVLLAVALRALIGGSVRPLAVPPLGQALSVFMTLLATRFFLGGGLGEELGWRGVMLPALQERMEPLRASLIIGVAHGIWHLPAYGAGVLFLTLFTVSGSIVFTWIYNNTEGNVFLPALMHATANASLPFLEQVVPAVDGELGFPMLVFLLWAAVAWLLVTRQGIAGKKPSGAEQCLG